MLWSGHCPTWYNNPIQGQCSQSPMRQVFMFYMENVIFVYWCRTGTGWILMAGWWICFFLYQVFMFIKAWVPLETCIWWVEVNEMNIKITLPFPHLQRRASPLSYKMPEKMSTQSCQLFTREALPRISMQYEPCLISPNCHKSSLSWFIIARRSQDKWPSHSFCFGF